MKINDLIAEHGERTTCEYVAWNIVRGLSNIHCTSSAEVDQYWETNGKPVVRQLLNKIDSARRLEHDFINLLAFEIFKRHTDFMNKRSQIIPEAYDLIFNSGELNAHVDCSIFEDIDSLIRNPNMANIKRNLIPRNLSPEEMAYVTSEFYRRFIEANKLLINYEAALSSTTLENTYFDSCPTLLKLALKDLDGTGDIVARICYVHEQVINVPVTDDYKVPVKREVAIWAFENNEEEIPIVEGFKVKYSSDIGEVLVADTAKELSDTKERLTRVLESVSVKADPSTTSYDEYMSATNGTVLLRLALPSSVSDMIDSACDAIDSMKFIDERVVAKVKSVEVPENYIDLSSLETNFRELGDYTKSVVSSILNDHALPKKLDGSFFELPYRKSSMPVDLLSNIRSTPTLATNKFHYADNDLTSLDADMIRAKLEKSVKSHAELKQAINKVSALNETLNSFCDYVEETTRARQDSINFQNAVINELTSLTRV